MVQLSSTNGTPDISLVVSNEVKQLYSNTKSVPGSAAYPSVHFPTNVYGERLEMRLSGTHPVTLLGWDDTFIGAAGRNPFESQ